MKKFESTLPFKDPAMQEKEPPLPFETPFSLGAAPVNPVDDAALVSGVRDKRQGELLKFDLCPDAAMTPCDMERLDGKPWTQALGSRDGAARGKKD